MRLPERLQRHVLATYVASLYNAALRGEPVGCRIPALPHLARVVKLVDTRDLKSLGEKSLYRFDSGPGHHHNPYVKQTESGTT